jgi:hypothetical protein
MRDKTRLPQGEIMVRKLLSIGAALAALAALPASAACSQANAIGTWKLYSAGASTNGAVWSKCTLVIAAGGAFGGSSVCSNSVGQSTGASGHVRLSNAANCTFAGSLTYKLGGAVSTVNEATMALSHQTVTGVGTFSNGEFVFTMVKIR